MAAENPKGLKDRAWEQTQIKVFTRWVQKQLMSRGMKFENIQEDYTDGVKLIALLEVSSKKTIPQKYNHTPKNNVQKRENIFIGLDWLQNGLGVRIVGIDADAIQKSNLKLTLGLTWTIINKFQIEEISVEESTAKEALLLWVKKNTAGYEGCNVTNFTTSFSNGLPYAALINKFKPDSLDYTGLPSEPAMDVAQKSFDAMRDLGICVYLDPEDVANDSPDEKSMITQCSELFLAFSKQSKAVAMADKIKKAIKIQKEIQALEDKYEKLANETLDAIKEGHEFLTQDYPKTVPGIKGRLKETISFSKDQNNKVADSKAHANTVYSQIQNKRKTTLRKPKEFPPDIAPEKLESEHQNLGKAVHDKRVDIQNELRQLIDSLLDAYRKKANEFGQKAADLDANIKALESTPLLERQPKYIEYRDYADEQKNLIQEELVPLYQALEKDDLHLEVEHSPDYYTSLFNVLRKAIVAVLKEIDLDKNADKGPSLPPELMSEIKKAFEEFDKDKDNKLKFYELHGALTYLGETTNDDECKALIKKYSDDPEFLSYDPFVQIILDRFSTAENKAAINEAFQTLAPSYPMITEAVISQYFNEDELNFLKKELPPQGDAGGYNAQEWVDSVFNE